METGLPMLEYMQSIMPLVLDGLYTSLKLFAIVFVIAMPLSVFLAIARIYAPKPFRWILGLYVWVFRGTPMIVQLIIVYSGFPLIGIVWSDWTCALFVFILSVAAYESEIVRAGIQSIDRGQFEACRVLGIRFPNMMRRIIIPQVLRRILPTTCSEAIILFKDTSLVTGIAMFDLMRRARNLASTNLRIESYMLAFILYLLIASLIVLAFNQAEKRLRCRM